MTPGVQLLIAKNGSVIFNKSYGHHTYNKKTSVKNEDIYDTFIYLTIKITCENKTYIQHLTLIHQY